jgi:hypothetical protein
MREKTTMPQRNALEHTMMDVSRHQILGILLICLLAYFPLAELKEVRAVLVLGAMFLTKCIIMVSHADVV